MELLYGIAMPLDLELAKSVGGATSDWEKKQMDSILKKYLKVVTQWKKIANKLGISRDNKS